MATAHHPCTQFGCRDGMVRVCNPTEGWDICPRCHGTTFCLPWSPSPAELAEARAAHRRSIEDRLAAAAEAEAPRGLCLADVATAIVVGLALGGAVSGAMDLVAAASAMTSASVEIMAEAR